MDWRAACRTRVFENFSADGAERSADRILASAIWLEKGPALDKIAMM